MSINVTNGSITRKGDPALLDILSGLGLEIELSSENIFYGTGKGQLQFDPVGFLDEIFSSQDVEALKTPYLPGGLRFAFHGNKIQYEKDDTQMLFINGMIIGEDFFLSGGGNYTMKDFLKLEGDSSFFSEYLSIPGLEIGYDYKESLDFLSSPQITVYNHAIYLNLSPVMSENYIGEVPILGPLLILISLDENTTDWEDVIIDISTLNNTLL